MTLTKEWTEEAVLTTADMARDAWYAMAELSDAHVARTDGLWDRYLRCAALADAAAYVAATYRELPGTWGQSARGDTYLPTQFLPYGIGPDDGYGQMVIGRTFPVHGDVRDAGSRVDLAWLRDATVPVQRVLAGSQLLGIAEELAALLTETPEPRKGRSDDPWTVWQGEHFNARGEVVDDVVPGRKVNPGKPRRESVYWCNTCQYVPARRKRGDASPIVCPSHGADAMFRAEIPASLDGKAVVIPRAFRSSASERFYDGGRRKLEKYHHAAPYGQTDKATGTRSPIPTRGNVLLSTAMGDRKYGVEVIPHPTDKVMADAEWEARDAAARADAGKVLVYVKSGRGRRLIRVENADGSPMLQRPGKDALRTLKRQDRRVADVLDRQLAEVKRSRAATLAATATRRTATRKTRTDARFAAGEAVKVHKTL